MSSEVKPKVNTKALSVSGTFTPSVMCQLQAHQNIVKAFASIGNALTVPVQVVYIKAEIDEESEEGRAKVGQGERGPPSK